MTQNHATGMKAILGIVLMVNLAMVPFYNAAIAEGNNEPVPYTPDTLPEWSFGMEEGTVAAGVIGAVGAVGSVGMEAEDDPASSIWLEGWGIVYEEDFHGMSMNPSENDEWVLTLHDRRDSSESIGTGTYFETLQIEPEILQVTSEDAADAGFLSWRVYYSAGVLTAPNDWSTPLSMFVVEAESSMPFVSSPIGDDAETTIVVWAFAVRATAPTVEDTEMELLAFIDFAFGNESSRFTGWCSDCKDFLDMDLDNARQDRDNAHGNCRDTFLWMSGGCVGGSFACKILYGLCVGACLSGAAAVTQRCMDRATDNYSRAVAAAYARYNRCIKNCISEPKD